MKFCSGCSVAMDESLFSRNRTNSDGRQRWCKACQYVANEAWRAKNPHKVRAYANAATKRHPERKRAIRRRARATAKLRKPEFEIWSQMIGRCTCVTSPSYPGYGARGITVHPNWTGKGGFARFIAHIGPRPSPLHSVDRYPDNQGNYEPGNVRWATAAEQNRNKNNNRWIEIDGRRMCMVDWAAESGVSSALIQKRIDELGWSERDAVLLPPRHNMITIGGVTRSASAWSRELQGHRHTVTSRIFQGWDPVEAVLVPKGMPRDLWRSQRGAAS